MALFEEIGCPGLWLQTFWLYIQNKHLNKEVVLSNEPEKLKASSPAVRKHKLNTKRGSNIENMGLEKVGKGLCLLLL